MEDDALYGEQLSSAIDELPCIHFMGLGVNDALLADKVHSFGGGEKRKVCLSHAGIAFDLGTELRRFITSGGDEMVSNCLNVLTVAVFASYLRRSDLTFPSLLIGDKAAADAELTSSMLNVDSNVFLLDAKENQTYTYFLEGSHSHLRVEACEDNDCKIRNALLTPKRDFRGAKITSSYDHWPPFCVNPANGETEPTGVFPEVFGIVARKLNLTIEYSPNPNPGHWGLNGGMLEYVENGSIDTSTAAFAIVYERALRVDFSPDLMRTKTGAFILNPNTALRFNFRAYTSEFTVTF